jgi:hypothetical protein
MACSFDIWKLLIAYEQLKKIILHQARLSSKGQCFYMRLEAGIEKEVMLGISK